MSPSGLGSDGDLSTTDTAVRLHTRLAHSNCPKYLLKTRKMFKFNCILKDIKPTASANKKMLELFSELTAWSHGDFSGCVKFK